MKRQRTQEERGSVALVEEAFHLLRQTPGSTLLCHAVGTLPFLLALLYFWADMARSPFAEANLLPGTFALVALFVWMKAWHVQFAQRLLAQLCAEPAPRLTFARFARAALHQAIVQPFGLFLLPPAIVLIVPAGWVYPFFANATVLDGDAVPDLKTLLKKSWEHTRLWPLQSQGILVLFKFFGLFVALNLLSALFAVPLLLKTLLGVETVLSQSPWAAFNTTLLAAVATLTFLCLDPLLKATFVLRCFHGESLRTGQDLKAELKSFASPAKLPALVLMLLLLQIPCSAPAATTNAPAPALSPRTLDASIDRVIQQREYTWRAPREATGPVPQGETLLQRLRKGLEEMQRQFALYARDVGNWLDKLFRGFGLTGGTGSFSFEAAMKNVLFLLLVLLAGLIVWLLFRVWKQRQPAEEIMATPLAVVPDVADENVGADQLPEAGWMRLARELLDRGELRLSLRAFYLATLAHLAAHQFITLARFKSNLDYQRELDRRAHALATVPALFAENVSTFERAWYGEHEVTTELLAHFAGNVEQLKSRSADILSARPSVATPGPMGGTPALLNS